ncbi:MAG: DUF1580 domain-containing protein [Planctomycetaceae bacterium]|nr:DUF1580 domain-containing protein [Planctomycetaceae bacterium]
MPINVETEKLITLGEACREFPPRGVSNATIARWIQKGVKGIRLETILLGSRRYTSREAILRFIGALNSESHVETLMTREQRQTMTEAAQHELQQAGI